MAHKGLSLQLFQVHRLKFREVIWYPRGFTQDDFVAKNNIGHDSLPSCIGGETLSRFFLEPMHLGQQEPVRCMINNKPYIDLMKADIQFSVDVHTGGKKSPVEQLNEKLWEAIQEQLFKGRKFFMDPLPAQKEVVSLHQYAGSSVHISIEGPAVPGLRAAPTVLNSHQGWQAYIPPSPERDEIEKAFSS